jgi:urease accessory protein
MDLVPAMSDASLAANRARGRIDLSVDCVAGVTRRRRVHESGSLRVRFPGAASGELEAVLINTAGGMAGGDVFDIGVSVGANARAVVTSAAAEKIYRSLGPHAVINLRIDVASDGTLFWFPQETILFDGAALSRSIEVDLAGTARLLLFEPLVFGRTGMGETVKRGKISDRWRIRRDGRVVYAESTRLGGAISQALAESAVANGGAAVATALLVPGDEALLDAVRAMRNDYRGEVGASAWNGHAVLRFCARDGADLRHDITCAGLALRAAPLPRLWIN